MTKNKDAIQRTYKALEKAIREGNVEGALDLLGDYRKAIEAGIVESCRGAYLGGRHEVEEEQRIKNKAIVDEATDGMFGTVDYDKVARIILETQGLNPRYDPYLNKKLVRASEVFKNASPEEDEYVNNRKKEIKRRRIEDMMNNKDGRREKLMTALRLLGEAFDEE